MKELFEQILKEIREMSDIEFDKAMEEAECGELRWSLEYAWNSELCEYLQWRMCYSHMWE